MLSGGQVDDLVVLALGATLAAVTAVLVRRRPHAAVVMWAVVLVLVPYWSGLAVAGPYLPPTSAVSALLLLALIGRRPVRLALPDLVVGVVVTTAVLAYVLGFALLHPMFVALTEWGLAYAVARVLCSSTGVEHVYVVLTVVVSAAAALAVLEFATGTNLFVELPGPGPKAGWAELQERGGIVRAEGAFGHSIALGATIGLTVPLAVAARMPRWAKIACLTALVAGAVVTFSRIGIGTTALGLVLSLVFLRTGMTGRMRAWLSVLLAGGALAAAPLVEQVFSAAGDEAAGSADYRADLLVLVPSMNLVGTASSAERTADGVLRFGGFRSIDSAVVHAGLTYGLLVMGILVALLLAAVWLLLTRRATPPLIAVVAQTPALLTVALITQYAAALWFVIGVAVSAHVLQRDAVAPASAGLGRVREDPARTLVGSVGPRHGVLVAGRRVPGEDM